jgi:signal transduction histidine kinase
MAELSEHAVIVGGRCDTPKDMQRRDAFLRAVVEASRRLVVEKNFDVALNNALSALGELTGFDRVYVLQLANSSRELVVRAEWNAPGIPTVAPVIKKLGLPYTAVPQIIDSLLSGSVYHSHTWQRSGLNAEINELCRVQSDLIVPVFVSGECWAGIGFDDCHTEREWMESEVQVLEGAAAVIAAAVERDRSEKLFREALAAERERAAQERAEKLASANEVLRATVQSLSSDSQLEPLLGQLLVAITRHLGASSSLVRISERALGTSNLTVAFDVNTKKPARLHVYPGSELEFYIADVSEPKPRLFRISEIALSGYAQYFGVSDCRVLVTIPMVLGTECLGMFVVGLKGDTPPSQEDLEFVQALANHAVLALALTRLAGQARVAAIAKEQARERTRIAREIHDTLLQGFVGAAWQLDALGLRLQNGHDRLALAKILNSMDEAIKASRMEIMQLRTEDSGPVQFTHALKEAMLAKLTGFDIDFQMTTPGTPLLTSARLAREVVQIFREALTNVVHHSGASAVKLSLSLFEHIIKVELSDNGCGFTLPHAAEGNEVGHFGITGMIERARDIGAKIEFDTATGQGTAVRLLVPNTWSNDVGAIDGK